MPASSPRLPPLGALAFFEAAGRHLSFTRAAEELSVTQGAVSRQIRQLEDTLGVALFRRLHRAIELTAEGRRFHQAVSLALDHIAVTTAELTDERRGRHFTVAATLAVSTFWLMPRVEAIRAQLGNLEVHVLATDVELDQLRGQFDLGIRYGGGSWPGYRAIPLSPGVVFPVCSPDYLASRAEPGGSADLLDHALLKLDQTRWDWLDWPAWFAHHGLRGPYPAPALQVNTYPLLIQAAVAGQGVALGWRHLVDEHLADGTLVRPISDTLPTGRGFHLVIPADHPDPDAVEPLTRWLVDAFR